ncbi:type II toxin-antitoxin system prevent-host-death family antitoxin [Streptomyces qinzhouensis]|uniref:Antitoxin n=1 Tax=Streptomyces qinzhouensis TaxID=2599401 RepID=A0A5B8JBS8_9ACTN|nr:type II toxin-antitoxin system prevent-host-death family antitoxin [Streptomyces qinzhouensis]QDY78836.1 type II toxin-antitoxin system Phd/YefM family antitoxin [Streptomyces qinzhouensis]
MTQPLPIESIRNGRAHLAEVVERADRDDVPTVITRRGKQIAATVSIEVLRKYQEWEEREINRIIDKRMAGPAPGIPIEDIMRETPARGE